MKKETTIAGAGVAGLVAAINLAKAGFKVVVYEKESEIGGHYQENPQMLPNWFSKEDVVFELEKCGIKINWLNKIEEVEINLGGSRVTIYGNQVPVGYTVLRGGENSFEKDLARQAQEAGVKIITNSFIDVNSANDIDIISIGIGKPITVGYGRVYRGNFNPHKTRVFLGSNHTPTVGYCYFFPHSANKATVKISRRYEETDVNLKENFEVFKNSLGEEIQEENFLYEFGSLRSFGVPQTAKRGQSLLVGEAAGFQDELFRFGIRYAVISGYLAARAIIDNLDYDALWKKYFLKEFNRTAGTRKIFEDFKKKNFHALPEKTDIRISIEAFKRLWLSRKLTALLAVYPLFQKLIFSKAVVKICLAILRRFKIVLKNQ